MSLSPLISARSTHMQRPWAFWLLFFFQFAAIGIYFTYLNIYYRNAGLTGSQIGLINMMAAMIGAAGSFAWGYLSDRSGKARYFISAGAVGSLVVAQFVPFLNTFTGFLALALLGSLLNSAPGTLVDSTTLSALGEQRENYGRYRQGGSIGYVAATFSSGFLFDRLGLNLMFPAYGIIMALFAITSLLLPPPRARLAKGGIGQGGLGALIRTPAWILFTVCIFLVWIAVNASISFLGVSLSAMGANQGLIGMAVTIGAVIEIPIMTYSGWIMRRFGPSRLLTAAMVLMVARYMLLGLMQAPQWAIAINLLNGPAFVFFWNSSITLANRMAPVEYAGTAQGMLNATMSLAGMASAPLTGLLFDLLGPNRLFLVMAGFVLAALVVYMTGSVVKSAQIEYNH